MRERGKTEIVQQQKLSCRLALSPQMQKALFLLQLPVMELEQAVTLELEENPLLEYSDEEKKLEAEEVFSAFEERFSSRGQPQESDLHTFIENRIASPASLPTLLMEQVREAFPHKEERELATLLIGHLDERGFLATPLEEIALLEERPLETLQNVLTVIQTFDPPGIGACDVRHSLLLQLKREGKEKSLAYALVSESFAEIETNRLPSLAKKRGCSLAMIKEALEKEIAPLLLHPATSFFKQENPAIIPDISVEERGGKLVVEAHEKSVPPFRINPTYLHLLTQESLPHETREYIEEKIASGKTLLRHLFERQKTLSRITHSLLEKHHAFFHQRQGTLTALTMKELGDSLGLHESTIARAVANKYLRCPRGTFPLRYFFTHAYVTESGGSLSAIAVKELLQKIVEEENPLSPHSDEKLSHLMKERGVVCARRTIAKYRKELKIGSRLERMRH